MIDGMLLILDQKTLTSQQSQFEGACDSKWLSQSKGCESITGYM